MQRERPCAGATGGAGGGSGAWTSVPSSTTADLIGVWGSGPSSVWTVGTGGTILRWNGSKWGGDERNDQRLVRRLGQWPERRVGSRRFRSFGVPGGNRGAVTVVQRVSSDLRLNPHLHAEKLLAAASACPIAWAQQLGYLLDLAGHRESAEALRFPHHSPCGGARRCQQVESASRSPAAAVKATHGAQRRRLELHDGLRDVQLEGEGRPLEVPGVGQAAHPSLGIPPVA